MDSSSQWSELRSPSVLIVLVCLCGARLELENTLTQMMLVRQRSIAQHRLKVSNILAGILPHWGGLGFFEPPTLEGVMGELLVFPHFWTTFGCSSNFRPFSDIPPHFGRGGGC